jgi:hypothetical protein
VVTARVEASPDRSDFAELGETIAASLVQAQEHTNRDGIQLEYTKQFTDDIRSQVAGRELAEINEPVDRLLLAAPGGPRSAYRSVRSDGYRHHPTTQGGPCQDHAAGHDVGSRIQNYGDRSA